MQLDRPEEALLHYQKALEIRPHFAEGYNNVGTAFHVLNRNEEAIAVYEKAIGMKPDYADAHGNLGIALEAVGRLSEASRSFETAIALAPKRVDLYRQLFISKKADAADPQLASLQELSKDATLTAEQQIDLHFALGKTSADLGEYERSFRHLVRGNALKRRQISYDEAATLSRFADIAGGFTRESIRSSQGEGDRSPVPIFIVGMPRSGSTLIEQILASHPLAFGGGELNEFARAVNDGGIPFGELSPAFSADQLRRLSTRYLLGIRSLAPSAERITDKLPSNFRFAGLIHLALPNARIIHSVRDPRDTCMSCFATLFIGASQPYSYELGELGRYYRAYRQLMDHWRAVLPPSVMLEVNYEDIVGDLEGQVRRILAHCGLPWDDACLAFHRTQRPIRTASAAQVRQPIYRNSVGRWRHYGPLIEPLLDALGDGNQLSVRDSALPAAGDLPASPKSGRLPG
jgi:tetratricopeptide (TPR) repeat protein